MKEYVLNVPTPRSFSYVKRNIPEVTVEQRERALKATHYNEFAFPAGMLQVDMLSDSGTTAMTDQQWSAMFLGDEAYGRNKGYYVLLDAMRDCFERGDKQKRIIDLVRTDCQDIEKMMNEMYLCEYEGGLFNGGAAQLERPNAFLMPQGRAAESILFEIVRKILRFLPTDTLIRRREISNKWVPCLVIYTIKNCYMKFRKEEDMKKILSKGTWILKNCNN